MLGSRWHRAKLFINIARYYGLGLECPPKAYILKDLVPNVAVYRGGALDKQLYHEGSNLINGLICLVD